MSPSRSSFDCSKSSLWKGAELSESLWQGSPVSSCGTVSPISSGISNFDSCALDMILWAMNAWKTLAAFVLRPISSSRYPWRNQRKSNTYFEENTVQFPTPLNTPSTGDCYLRDSYESCDHSPATIKITPYKLNETLNLGDKFTAISDPSTVSLYHSSYGYVDMFANRNKSSFSSDIRDGDSAWRFHRGYPLHEGDPLSKSRFPWPWFVRERP